MGVRVSLVSEVVGIHAFNEGHVILAILPRLDEHFIVEFSLAEIGKVPPHHRDSKNLTAGASFFLGMCVKSIKFLVTFVPGKVSKFFQNEGLVDVGHSYPF